MNPDATGNVQLACYEPLIREGQEKEKETEGGLLPIIFSFWRVGPDGKAACRGRRSRKERKKWEE